MSDVVFPDAGPSSSPDRPSLFELLADEQLRDLFHPVIHYVLSYLTQRYPDRLFKLLHHHEEVYALLLLLLEQHHLRKHNASTSEHFYQLDLVPRDGMPTPRQDMVVPRGRRRMNRRQRWGMLVFLVGLPYVRIKAQQYFGRLRGNEEDGEGIAECRSTSQRIFKRLYPFVNLGLDLTLLGYDIAYLFDRTDSYRPWHRWLGLQIQRKGPVDQPTFNRNSSLLSRLPPLLPPLLLLLKLSQWWYSPASPRSLPVPQTSATNHHLIPPPKPLPILPTADIYPPLPLPPDDSEEDDDQAPRPQSYEIGKKDYGKCPLCSRKWQNPAILESGWVVCWRCGWDALHGDEEDGEGGKEKTKGRCPITGVEVSRNDLRRVLL